MARLVILVEFRVKPDSVDAFRRLILENAAASLKNEPGCSQFDVLVPDKGDDGRFVLYEIYADAAAFDAHLRADHYHRFDKEATPMILEKIVTRLKFPEAGPGARG